MSRNVAESGGFRNERPRRRSPRRAKETPPKAAVSRVFDRYKTTKNICIRKFPIVLISDVILKIQHDHISFNFEGNDNPDDGVIDSTSRYSAFSI